MGGWLGESVRCVCVFGVASGSHPCSHDAEIVRSRDPAVLDTLPIIVDVGATYEPEKGRFDHHQRGFEHTFDDGRWSVWAIGCAAPCRGAAECY